MQEVSSVSDFGQSGNIKVLISYRYMSFKSSKWRESSCLIHVNSSRDILRLFGAEMHKKRHYDFEMLCYVPENGRRKF